LSATDYTLYNGAAVVVNFVYGNSAANATLNVGGSGAKSITYYGANVPAYMIKANDVVTMVYNGANWEMVDFDDFGDLDASYVNL
jgi:hypothetical protein